jgi:hypothetical protein
MAVKPTCVCVCVMLYKLIFSLSNASVFVTKLHVPLTRVLNAEWKKAEER